MLVHYDFEERIFMLRWTKYEVHKLWRIISRTSHQSDFLWKWSPITTFLDLLHWPEYFQLSIEAYSQYSFCSYKMHSGKNHLWNVFHVCLHNSIGLQSYKTDVLHELSLLRMFLVGATDVMFSYIDLSLFPIPPALFGCDIILYIFRIKYKN